jgi:proteasome activator subunit 4
MKIPDLSSLHIDDRPQAALNQPPAIPDDITNSDDRYVQKLKSYAKGLPYSIEPYSAMMELLDFICIRLTQCVEAKDFEVGMSQWDTLLT